LAAALDVRQAGALGRHVARGQDRGMVLATLRALPPTPMLILTFLCPALKASTMLGVIFPGEIAILVASGVLWATAVAVAGYLAGASLVVVQERLGMVSNVGARRAGRCRTGGVVTRARSAATIQTLSDELQLRVNVSIANG